MSTTQEPERFVGGLWCREVLAQLSQYVDGELDVATVERVADHVADCHRCATFGETFAKATAAIRAQLAADDDVDATVDDILAAIDATADP